MQIKFKMPLLCMCLKFMRHACIVSSMLHLPLYCVRYTEKPFARDMYLVIERATYVLGLERRLLMSPPSLAEPVPTATGRNRLQMTPYSAPLTAVSIKIITRVFEIFVTFLRTFQWIL